MNIKHLIQVITYSNF